MEITTPLNFKAWLEESNKDDFPKEMLEQELNNFIEEFNNWVTANFREEFAANYLVKDVCALDLENPMLEAHCDSVRVHSQSFIIPIRWFIINQFYIAQYTLAVKNGDTSRFDYPF